MNVSFDLPVRYFAHGSDTILTQTVHHVSIPRLAPNEEVQFLLASTDSTHEIFVYKAASLIADVGKEQGKKSLPIYTVPVKRIWDDAKYWMLLGPTES